MQNRKDLLQAHRLMTQRAALALMHGEPDPPDRPLRRLNMGMFSSILVAVMVAAVFGIWGVIAPGGAQGLDSPGILIQDSQTGASYIWCQGGKLLCPVVNYASARLALESSSPTQRSVSQASLSTYPRGPEIGIPGLPVPLPDSSELAGAPWSTCVQSVKNPSTGQTTPPVTTLVGGQSVGGTGLGGNALVVQASGADWLIWNGQRMYISAANQGFVLVALSATPQQVESVPVTWLNAFPQGPDFAPPDIPGLGGPVTGPAGNPTHVGQVFSVTAVNSTVQYYVMLSSGLASITPAQAALLTTEKYAKRPLAPALVANHLSPVHIPAGGLPQKLPAVRSYPPATPLCAVYSGSASTAPGSPQLTAGGTVPAGGLSVTSAGGVDQMTMPPGKAALVGEVSGTGGTGPTVTVASYFLVTGGLRYGLASPNVASYLGYSLNQQRTLLPAGVVNLIPQGPALDPTKAREPVPAAG